jgi:hypothetical protein
MNPSPFSMGERVVVSGAERAGWGVERIDGALLPPGRAKGSTVTLERNLFLDIKKQA